MKKVLPFLIILALAGIVGYCYRDRLVGYLPLYRAEDNTIRATGTIEIQEVDISSKLTGYITSLQVEESDEVSKGQLLAVIDRPDLQAKLDRDRASLKKAKALLADLRKGARKEEIAQIDANIKAALTRFNQAEKDYRRYLALYEDKVVSERQMEEFRLSRNVAREDLKALREKKSLLLQGARDDRITAQEEEIRGLEANIRLTNSEIEDTCLESPISGVVLLKNFEEGELAAAGSIILTLGDPEDCWINVYIPSTYLGFISAGQEASIKVDSFPGRLFSGKISEIARRAEYTPRESITPDERANLVFRVKVSLDNREGFFKPGMPADVIMEKKEPK